MAILPAIRQGHGAIAKYDTSVDPARPSGGLPDRPRVGPWAARHGVRNDRSHLSGRPELCRASATSYAAAFEEATAATGAGVDTA